MTATPLSIMFRGLLSFRHRPLALVADVLLHTALVPVASSARRGTGAAA